MDCVIKGTSTDCTAWQGCVREKDCNRCDDRLCHTCNNFDERYTYCTTCITNASKINGLSSNVCDCDDNFWYDDYYLLADHPNEDYTDKCVPCDIACKKCSSLSYQTCTECRTNFYKQDGANTCLDFCPTGYTTWNGSTWA